MGIKVGLSGEKWAMFRGTTKHTIDSKGRLIVPKRFRNFIKKNGGGLMVTGFEGALRAYTYPKWNEVETKMMAQSRTTAAMRRFRRHFLGAATECPADRQHRILVPPNLRQRACLKHQVVLVGQLEHFEIWDRENFEADSEIFDSDLDGEEVRDEIADLGL